MKPVKRGCDEAELCRKVGECMASLRDMLVVISEELQDTLLTIESPLRESAEEVADRTLKRMRH